jgi:hypothetical protein
MPTGVTMKKNTIVNKIFDITVPNKWERPIHTRAIGLNNPGQTMSTIRRKSDANNDNLLLENIATNKKIRTIAIPVSLACATVMRPWKYGLINRFFIVFTDSQPWINSQHLRFNSKFFIIETTT